jgi:hypothetical protein
MAGNCNASKTSVAQSIFRGETAARMRAIACAFGVFSSALVGGGCATRSPSADDIAAAAAFTKRIVAGQPFRHLTYATGDGTGPLWIYIEGDGRPWLTEYVPAANPTPGILVALEAMTAGRRPALYLGRPCYFDGNVDPGCGPDTWTHRRFAPEVVASMAAALRTRIDAHGWAARRLVFVGFSGGGTLAALLAREFERTCALITMASPLDIDEWVRARGYSALDGSLNPAALPGLPEGIRQLHLRGELDTVVAADNGYAFKRRNPQAEFRTVKANRHGREWVATWRSLLQEPGFPAAHCGGVARSSARRIAAPRRAGGGSLLS